MTIQSPNLPSGLRRITLAVALAGLASSVATATPYATCLTNSGGVISFRLNESADNVQIIYNAGAATNDLGALPKGLQTVNLAVTGTYSIQVTKAGGAGYLQGVVNQVSEDTNNFVKFGLTNVRGLAVNRNTNSPYFGRIYVGVSAGGTVASNQFNLGSRVLGDGVYLLNADQTDAVGQGDTPRTGGLKFDYYANSAESPGRFCLGPDDMLYISDWSDANGGVWVTDPNVATNASATSVLFGIGGPTLETNIHGSVSGLYVEGSLAGNNLVLYTADEDIDPGNAVLRYDIGAGPLPFQSAGSQAFTFGLAAQWSKILRGPGGKWYCSNRRADYATSTGLMVRDPSGAALWSSLTAWRTLIGNASANDSYFSETRGFDVTMDGRYLATFKALTNLTAAPYNMAANTVLLLPLEDGIPNITNMVIMPTSPRAGTGRDLVFDAAGNMYTLSADQGLRIYSPGGTSVATTGSDGTFSNVRTQPDVALTATTPIASEDGTTGQFTLTRSGGSDGYGTTNAALTVGYTVSGTAGNGVDYATLSGAVTFGVGETAATITVAPLPDALAESTETVIVTITNSPNYLPLGSQATVFISDTNTPVLAVSSISPSMYERLTNDYAAVVISRNLGNTNLFQAIMDPGSFTFAGTAIKDVDYVVNSNLFPVWFLAGDRALTLNLVAPLNNSILNGQRTLTIGLLSGTDYVAATNIATTSIIDDEDLPESVLWSDNFDLADSATNYVVRFGSLNGVDDYTCTFGYDYSIWNALPPAPHSGASTLGLLVNVNKDGSAAAAGVNLYATNKVFGTNFALRFDMYLFCGSASTTEYGIFGVNHSGSQTNWFRSNANGFTNSAYDGLWAVVESDASGTDDYLLFTGPKTSNTVGTVSCVQPTIRARKNATSFSQVFKSPPYITPGGSPANPNASSTPSWADVELSQSVNAGVPVITLRINHTTIYQYTNTLANTVAATNGLIMLGYCDAYDSIGNSSGIIYDNVRVVGIDPPKIVSQPLSAVIAVGGSTNLTVGVTGTTTGVTNYQWRFNGTAIAGATNSSLPVSNIQVTNYGSYTVVVSDGVYTLTSAAAVVAPPAINIVTQPAGRAAVVGSPVAFSVVAATSTGVTNYQWRLYSTNLVGQTGTTLSIPSVQANSFGPYTVRVSDGYGAVTSLVANLTVAVQPSLAYGVSGSSLNLGFGTEVGPSYVVEYKGELTNGAWMPLVTNIGTGGPLTVPDSIGTGSRFYRVRMQ